MAMDLRARLLKRFSPRLAALERVSTQEVVWIRSMRNIRNVPFNGDPRRLEIVEALLTELPCDLGIETGTWVGNTTQWLVRKLPRVQAIELDAGLVGICTLRLGQERNLTLIHGSSSEHLGRILMAEKSSRPFVYLDAHDRGTEPPLDAELGAVVAHANSVVLIDDFKVPGTPFGFGTYGEVALDIGYARRFLGSDVRVFGPSYPCEGKTRGWALFGTGRAEAEVAAFATKTGLAPIV